MAKWRRDEKIIQSHIIKSPNYRLHTDFTPGMNPEMLSAPKSVFKNDFTSVEMQYIDRVFWSEKWLKEIKNNPRYCERCRNLDKDVNTKYGWAHLIEPDSKYERRARRFINKMIELGFLIFVEM